MKRFPLLALSVFLVSLTAGCQQLTPVPVVTAPAVTSTAFSQLNLSTPTASLVYTDMPPNGVSECYFVQTLDGSGVSAASNTFCATTTSTLLHVQLSWSAPSGYTCQSTCKYVVSRAAAVVTPVGTLTISPTSGSVVASLALGHANTWSALQTFGTSISIGGVTAAGATGTSNVVFSNSPTLVTPVLGAATATSLIASGIVDGEAPITLTTGAACTLGTTSGCNATAYDSGYTFNQEATPATAITYTLPTAAAGKQYCVSNSYNGSAATTGTIELLTSASGQFIVFTDGTLSATGGYVISGGAAGDAACVVGMDSTHWQLYVNRGTWAKH